MRVPRIAAIALLSTVAIGTSATAAFADTAGEIEPSPHAVHPGHTVRLSTESCGDSDSAKVHLSIDEVDHTVWLNHETDEGLTGWFSVPKDADKGKVGVEGFCSNGHEIEGSFWVKKHHHHHHHWDHDSDDES